MRTYTSKEILESEDLYELQDSFCSSGSPFKYQLTEGELEWALFLKDKYSIADYVLGNTDMDRVMTFECETEMSQALHDDGTAPKAVMLSDDTALQKLFWWLCMGF